MTSSIHGLVPLSASDRGPVSQYAMSPHQRFKALGVNPIGFNMYSCLTRLLYKNTTVEQVQALFDYTASAKSGLVRILWPSYSMWEYVNHVHPGVPTELDNIKDSSFQPEFLVACDAVFEAAKKSGVKLAVCLFWHPVAIEEMFGEEHPAAIQNLQSKTVRYMVGVTKWFVKRYMSHPAMGVYAFTNEQAMDPLGVTASTPKQLGDLYQLMADTVRKIDARKPTMVDLAAAKPEVLPARRTLSQTLDDFGTVTKGVDIIGVHVFIDACQWLGKQEPHLAKMKPAPTNGYGLEDFDAYLSALKDHADSMGKVLLASEFSVSTVQEDDVDVKKKLAMLRSVTKFTHGGMWWDVNLLANQVANQPTWYIEPGTTRANKIAAMTLLANESKTANPSWVTEPHAATNVARARYEPKKAATFVRDTRGMASFTSTEEMASQEIAVMFWMRKNFAPIGYERVANIQANTTHGFQLLFDGAGKELYIELRSASGGAGNSAGTLPALDELGEWHHYCFERILAPDGTYVIQIRKDGFIWDISQSSTYDPVPAGSICHIGGRNQKADSSLHGAMVSLEGFCIAKKFEDWEVRQHLAGFDPQNLLMSQRQGFPNLTYGTQVYDVPAFTDLGQERVKTIALQSRTASLESNLALLQAKVDTHVADDTLHEKLFAYNSLMSAIRSRDFLSATLRAEIRRYGVFLWRAGERIEAGMCVLPTIYQAGNNTISLKIHRAMTSGVTGSKEPTWATADHHIDPANSSTTDGSVTWRAYNIIHIDCSKATSTLSGDGSQATPFTDLRGLDANAGKASINAFSSGRAVAFLRGATVNTYQVTNGAGSMARLHIKLPSDDTQLLPERRNVFAYGTGDNPVIDGGGNGALRYGIREEAATATIHQGFVTYQDLDVTALGGCYPGLSAAAVMLPTSSTDTTLYTTLPRNSKFIHCHVHDFVPKTVGGVDDNDINGIWAVGSGNALIECTVANNYDDNVWMVGNHIDVLGCRIYGSGQCTKSLPTRNRGDELQLNSSLWGGNGNTPTQGLRVIGNYIDHPNGFKHGVLINPECSGTNNYSRDYVVSHNVILGHKGSSGTTQIAMYLSGFEGDVHNNYIYGGHSSVTDQAVICFSKIRFYNNLVRSRKQAALGLGTISLNSGAVINDARGSDVLNNTFIGEEGPPHGIVMWGTDTRCTAYNNLVIGFATGIHATYGSKIGYNAFWQCTTNTTGSATDLGGNVTADPLVYNGVPYSMNSPLFRAGRTTSRVIIDDLGRRIRAAGAPTIGAVDLMGMPV